jgi:hypothetical protein
MNKIEKQYDDLSIIRLHEMLKQWTLHIRAPLQELHFRREYNIYHVYYLFVPFNQDVLY